MTLFEKYGGFATISRVTLSFYDGVLESDRLGPYFERVDLPKLIDHQTKFLASLLGGPASYGDDHLRQLHAPLRITDGDFDEMLAILRRTLEDHAFAPADIAQVETAFERRRPVIVHPPVG